MMLLLTELFLSLYYIYIYASFMIIVASNLLFYHCTSVWVTHWVMHGFDHLAGKAI